MLQNASIIFIIISFLSRLYTEENIINLEIKESSSCLVCSALCTFYFYSQLTFKPQNKTNNKCGTQKCKIETPKGYAQNI